MAQIPVAALVGLITLIAMNTFAWSSVVLILRINWIDATVVVLVTVVTVWEDLCVAVIIGLIINALGFSWNAATRVKIDQESKGSTRIFRLHGPLFFGSAMNFKMEVNPVLIEEPEVILDFSHGTVLDISGSNAIAETRSNLMDAGKTVVLRGLPAEVVSELPQDAKVDNSEYDHEKAAAPPLVPNGKLQA
uniref:STAS domain-containing protein n=1 Tax=Alexandrium catenella TaxID=2925 RepID=A0A7S1RS54_ALECA